MDKRLIKKLAIVSYSQGILDERKVEKIVKNLTRVELNRYIKALKAIEKQKTVYVYLPSTVKGIDENQFKQLFPDKKVIFKEDASLVAGIKIVNNDLVYEQSIKNNLNNLISFLS